MENFDNLKRNLHKLDEQPVDAVWDRLEGKLDNLSNKKKISKYKLLSFAASLIALVAIISVISQNLQSDNRQMVALQNSDQYLLEDLNIYDEDVSYSPILASDFYLENNEPIDEGNMKKLLPTKRIGKAYPKSKGHFNWVFGTWIFKNAVHKVDEANEDMVRKELVDEAPSLNVALESGKILLQISTSDLSLRLNEAKSDSNKVVFEGVNKDQQIIITRVDQNNVILNSGIYFDEDLHLDSNSTLIYQNVINF